jgi:hypothetical protein
MCNPASFVATKNDVFWSKRSESHEVIIRENALPDGGPTVHIIRLEITPPCRDFTAPLERWEYRVDDQDVLPTWYDAESVEARARRALRLWHKHKVVVEGSVHRRDSQTYVSGNATVKASGDTTVEAFVNTTVLAYGRATVWAYGATVKAYQGATVWAYDATVEASGGATVDASGDATVEASGRAIVVASGDATVEASGDTTVEVYDDAIVVASGRATIIQHSESAKITLRKGSLAVLVDRRHTGKVSFRRARK